MTRGIRDKTCYIHERPHCGCLAMIEIVVNDMSEWVVVKFIVEHNHPLSKTPSKSRMHRLHSSAHRTHDVRSLIRSLNSEGIDPSNIARVCNASSGCIAHSGYSFTIKISDQRMNIVCSIGR